MTGKGFAFIFARRGSKGLKRKNIQLLGGRPLIEWTLDYLCGSSFVNKVCISTDDEFILDRYDANYSRKIITHLRPEHLCGDLITTEEVLADAYTAVMHLIKKHHIGVYMQITEPFRPDNILDLCAEKHLVGQHDSVFAATEYHKNFWIEQDNDLIRANYTKNFNSPRQLKTSLIREDTGICLVSDMNLFRQGRRIGDKPGYVFYEHHGSLLDIHNKCDLALAEAFLNSRSNF